LRIFNFETSQLDKLK